MTRRLALAIGDPNGIGPEIAIKALAILSPNDRQRITVFGPGNVLAQTATVCGLSHVLNEINHVEVGTLDRAARFGTIEADAGHSAVASATAAIEACKRGVADAVIACPHHETSIRLAGIPFSGYPSLVARVCGARESEVFLMLVGAGFRIVHATLHESVQSALNRLTPQLVKSAALAGIKGCALLGEPAPKVALFGINPHAYEGTLFGEEDASITMPAA